MLSNNLPETKELERNSSSAKKLSVIIPAYNAEKFLVKCVDSVANQTYPNIEIIIVNNGSQDSTPQLCEELKDKYNNRGFKIINLTPNQGRNWARRAGVAASNGEYITFIDSDDYIDLEAYEKTIKILENNHCDMVQFGSNLVDLDGNVIKKWIREELTFNNPRDAYLYFLTYKTATYGVWDKVYKRAMFDNIYWLKISALEDFQILAQLFAKSEKFMTISNLFYYYVQHSNSTMHKASPNNSNQANSTAATDLVVNLTQEKFPELLPEAIWHRIVLYHINVCSAMDYSDKQIVKQNVQSLLTDYKRMSIELKKQGRKLYIAKKMRLKQNMKIWLLVYCPKLYKVYLTTRLKIHALTGI